MTTFAGIADTIVTDASFVYYLVQGGGVYKVAK
jgi:hypothetical protein